MRGTYHVANCSGIGEREKRMISYTIQLTCSMFVFGSNSFFFRQIALIATVLRVRKLIQHTTIGLQHGSCFQKFFCYVFSFTIMALKLLF